MAPTYVATTPIVEYLSGDGSVIRVQENNNIIGDRMLNNYRDYIDDAGSSRLTLTERGTANVDNILTKLDRSPKTIKEIGEAMRPSITSPSACKLNTTLMHYLEDIKVLAVANLRSLEGSLRVLEEAVRDYDYRYSADLSSRDKCMLKLLHMVSKGLFNDELDAIRSNGYRAIHESTSSKRAMIDRIEGIYRDEYDFTEVDSEILVANRKLSELYPDTTMNVLVSIAKIDVVLFQLLFLGEPYVKLEDRPIEDQLEFYARAVYAPLKLSEDDDKSLDTQEKRLAYYKAAFEYAKTVIVNHPDLYKDFCKKRELLGLTKLGATSTQFTKYSEDIEINKEIEEMVVPFKVTLQAPNQETIQAQKYRIVATSLGELEKEVTNKMQQLAVSLVAKIAEEEANEAKKDILKKYDSVVLAGTEKYLKRFRATIQQINEDPDSKFYIVKLHGSDNYRAISRAPITVLQCSAKKSDETLLTKRMGYGMLAVTFNKDRIVGVSLGGVAQALHNFRGAAHPHKETNSGTSFCTGNMSESITRGVRGNLSNILKDSSVIESKVSPNLLRETGSSMNSGPSDLARTEVLSHFTKDSTDEQKIEAFSWFVGINDIALYLDAVHTLMSIVDYRSPFIRCNVHYLQRFLDDDDLKYQEMLGNEGYFIDEESLTRMFLARPETMGAWKKYVDTDYDQPEAEREHINNLIESAIGGLKNEPTSNE